MFALFILFAPFVPFSPPLSRSRPLCPVLAPFAPFSPPLPVLEQNHAADDVAVVHGLERRVDVVNRDGLGDHLIELEMAL